MPISVTQMKAGIILTATMSGSLTSTYQLLAELEAIKRRVQKLSGKHLMYVHNVTGDISPATRSMIVDEAMVRRAVTGPMYLSPPAFSTKVAGGKMLPNKTTAIAANFRKEMQAQFKNKGKKAILNRAQFIELYFENFSPYGTSALGNLLNSSTQHSLK
jgi:hypothetical protein